MRTTTKLIVASGGLSLLLSAGAGIASAQPAVDDVIVNSTCTYPQVTAALAAQDPQLAQQLQEVPAANGWLKSLIAAPPDQRRLMVAQAKAFPGVQPFIPVITAVANTCQNF
ncbi:hemophore-related protein [Mycolicibacterium phlei]